MTVTELFTAEENPPSIDEPKLADPKPSQARTCSTCHEVIEGSFGDFMQHKKAHKAGLAAPQPGRSDKPSRATSKLPAKREDASALLGFLYSTGANFVPSRPAQKAMMWQAPMAGRVLDDAIAGTLIDKPVQLIAGASNKWEPVFNLVSFPFLIFALDKQPALYPAVKPVLRRVMKGNLEAALREMKREKDETDRLEKLAAEVGMELTVDVVDTEGEHHKVDLIDQVLQQIFAKDEEPVAA